MAEASLRLAYYRPDELQESDFEDAVSLLEVGGEVERAPALVGLRRAHGVALGRIGSALCVVAAAKRPLPTYSSKIAQSANVPTSSLQGPELGYVATAPAHRRKGYAGLAVKLVCERANPVWATTRIDNGSMQTLLAREGFEARGKAWKSDVRGGVGLELWSK